MATTSGADDGDYENVPCVSASATGSNGTNNELHSFKYIAANATPNCGSDNIKAIER